MCTSQINANNPKHIRSSPISRTAMSFQPVCVRTPTRWRAHRTAPAWRMARTGIRSISAKRISRTPMIDSHPFKLKPRRPPIQSGNQPIHNCGWTNLSMPKYPKTKTTPTVRRPFANPFRCIGAQRTVAFMHLHIFPVVCSMKPLSALTLALLTLPLVAACTAQVTPTSSDEPSMTDDFVSSSAMSGPYLEDDDSSSDAAVELRINASASTTQP